jgi:O-antigen ligase
MEIGRSRIWKNGLATVWSEPLVGAGFRNFGEEVSELAAETNEVFVFKDNAHGFLQDTFVEHGIFLGCAVIASFFGIVFRLIQTVATVTEKTYALILVTLISPYIFSGGVFNAFGFYLMLAAAAPKLCHIGKAAS